MHHTICGHFFSVCCRMKFQIHYFELTNCVRNVRIFFVWCLHPVSECPFFFVLGRLLPARQPESEFTWYSEALNCHAMCEYRLLRIGTANKKMNSPTRGWKKKTEFTQFQIIFFCFHCSISLLQMPICFHACLCANVCFGHLKSLIGIMIHYNGSYNE